MRTVRLDIFVTVSGEREEELGKKLVQYLIDRVKLHHCQKLLIICLHVTLSFFLNIKIENKNLFPFYIILP